MKGDNPAQPKLNTKNTYGVCAFRFVHVSSGKQEYRVESL